LKTEELLVRKSSILGAEVIRVNPGFRGDWSDPETRIRIVSGLKHLIPVARNYGLHLALENHGPIGMKADNVLWILQRTGNPRWLGACLDFGNFYPEEMSEGPGKLCPWATHVHAKSHDIVDGKEATIDYPERIRELRRGKFRGYLSVEFEGRQGDDELKCTRKTIKLIQRCLGRTK